MTVYPEPMDAHDAHPACVCTDGLAAYRDVTACCDSPVEPVDTEEEERP